MIKGTGSILEVKNISKNFGTVRALSDVSFNLERGKILGLIGDNNAGKSTLLKILSGGLQPSSGEIYLNGMKIKFKNPADAMKKRVAIVYQFLELVDIAMVWENFFMGRELTKRIGPFKLLDIRGMERQAAESIAKYGHTFNIKREIRELSGGQKQIIAINRAIEANPEILLLDEPYHGLSKRVINDIFDLLKKAKEEKSISIIITSQWYEQISGFVNDVVVMRMGKIVGQSDAESANSGKIFKLAMGLTT